MVAPSKRPLVSVVVPAYNEERHVQHCIDSLLQQTYKPLELVFIDDGSKDSTPDILKRNVKRHKNFRFHIQKNAGPGAARNAGARLAKGKILVFVDADMIFDKKYIDVLTRPIREGKTIGTVHTKELVANKQNVWARSWCINRIPDSAQHTGSGVYRAVLRAEFLRVGGFDSSKGYFDDDLSQLGLSTPVPAVCYHNNPEGLWEAFSISLWVGRSLVRDPWMRNRARVGVLVSGVVVLGALALALRGVFWPLLALAVLGVIAWLAVAITKTIPRVRDEHRYEYLVTIPILWAVRLKGFYFGVWQQMYRDAKKKFL